MDTEILDYLALEFIIVNNKIVIAVIKILTKLRQEDYIKNQKDIITF